MKTKNEIIDFIKNNSISLGYYVVYEYNRKYVKENLKDDFGYVKTYTQTVKRYKKNGIVFNK